VLSHHLSYTVSMMHISVIGPRSSVSDTVRILSQPVHMMSQVCNHNESWSRVTPASPSVRKIPRLPPYQRRSLSPPSPQRSASTRSVGSLVVTRDIIVVGGRRSGNVRRLCTFELVQDNLGNGLPHGNACSAHFSLAEVIAPSLEMIVFDLSMFE
jgi:hypothetical protein